MFDSDRKWFGNRLRAVFQLRDKAALTAETFELFWEAMSPYSQEAVEWSIKAHVADPERGRFTPMPADLVARIKAQFLSANEAWAMALLGTDEALTVVTNDMIDRAMLAANPILAAGDKVGARMAFVAAYERDLAGRTGMPVWRVSLGHDMASREPVLVQAIQSGYLTHAQVYGSKDGTSSGLLPSPVDVDGQAIAGLLTGKRLEPGLSIRDRLRALAAQLRAESEAQEAKKREAMQADQEFFEANRQRVLEDIKRHEKQQRRAAQ